MVTKRRRGRVIATPQVARRNRSSVSSVVEELPSRGRCGELEPEFLLARDITVNVHTPCGRERYNFYLAGLFSLHQQLEVESKEGNDRLLLAATSATTI